MSLCDKLKAAKKDEEGGITEYGNLKSEMTPDHQDHINTVEGIISDEKSHLSKVNDMIKYFGCLEIKSKTKRRKY
jgi:gamma-glutamyl:cysteine ligase YbdK (ATP-grasp superfamily)